MNPKGSSPLTGIICLWPGAIVDIPNGWLLCDGTNGTPDMRNVFVRGAGDIYDPGDTGGSNNHTHVLTMDAHYHWLTGGTYVTNDSPNGDYKAVTNSKLTTGSMNTMANVPIFRALAFIMKE